MKLCLSLNTLDYEYIFNTYSYILLQPELRIYLSVAIFFKLD